MPATLDATSSLWKYVAVGAGACIGWEMLGQCGGVGGGGGAGGVTGQVLNRMHSPVGTTRNTPRAQVTRAQVCTAATRSPTYPCTKVLHRHLPLLQQTCGSGATHSARKLPALPLCAMNCHTHAANLPRIKVQAMQDMPLAWTDGATAAVASRPTTTRVRTDIMIAPEVLAAAKDTRKGCDTQPKQDRREKNVSILVHVRPPSFCGIARPKFMGFVPKTRKKPHARRTSRTGLRATLAKARRGGSVLVKVILTHMRPYCM